MSKILVTGGAGFIGSHLVQRLLTEGFEPVVIDNIDSYYDTKLKEDNLALFEKEVSFYKASILDQDALAGIFKKEKIAKIVHLAARPGVRPSLDNPVLYQQINTQGTIALLEQAKKNHIKQFIFSSTSSIYGNNDIPFKESDPVEKQLSPYAMSKKAAETYCKFYAENYGLPTTCLRFFTVYGPRQRPEMAIHKFTSLLYQKEPIPMFGDGTTSRDYTYVSDIIDGVLNSLFKKLDFEIINLGNSTPVTLKKLIQMLEEATGCKAIIDKKAEQPGDMKRTYADISKAKALLNYKPKIKLEDGLAKFAGWFKEYRLSKLAVKN